MTSLTSLRQRLPFVVFVVVLILLVVMLGFVCLCISDHPGQAIERVLHTLAALPPLVVVWAFMLAAALAAASWPARAMVTDRASPAVLQRFLF